MTSSPQNQLVVVLLPLPQCNWVVMSLILRRKGAVEKYTEVVILERVLAAATQEVWVLVLLVLVIRLVLLVLVMRLVLLVLLVLVLLLLLAV